MNKKKKWLLGAGVAALVAVAGLFIAASIFSKRFQPYIRQQAIQYLSDRFASEVELQSLRVRVPGMSPIRLLLTRGHGVVALVEGERLALRHKGRRDVPPMFAMRKFSFKVDVGKLFEKTKVVRQVILDGMEITIPPPGQRPDFN